MSDSTNEKEQAVHDMGADGQKQNKKRIPRPPFYANEYIDMAEALDWLMEQFGTLILALMSYIVDGTIPADLPPELKPTFTIYRKKIDYANGKYEQTCEKNRKNGSKGGRPRKRAAVTEPEEAPTSPQTELPKKAKTAPKVKMPPNREQFIKLIEAGQDEGAISNECDPDDFFDWAEALKWKVNGESTLNVGDFLSYAAARYPVKEAIGHIPSMPKLARVYGIIFKEFHGLRDDEGNTGALAAAIDFLKAYDGGWSFHGQEFSDDQWREALNEFMEDLKTE